MMFIAVPFWWLIVMCIPSSYCDSGATTRHRSHCFYLLSVRTVRSVGSALLSVRTVDSSSIALLLSSFCTNGTISRLCSSFCTYGRLVIDRIAFIFFLYVLVGSSCFYVRELGAFVSVPVMC